MQSFGFGDQLVRVADRDGRAWFVANDVCAALEINNSRQAVSRLDDDEKDDVTTNDVIGRIQKMTIVSESGVYSLIFTSRKESAKAFRKWVTAEVLPALRETGRYEMPTADDAKSKVHVPELGTRDDRESIRVAVLMVREMKDLYGQQAGRQMWVKLGFPVPDVDLSPAPPAPGEPKQQAEGDFHSWSIAAGVKVHRREATSIGDLYASYLKYCSLRAERAMPPERFKKSALLIWDTEEHPEMVRVIVTRK